MLIKRNKQNVILAYTSIGALFGLTFPVFATLVDALLTYGSLSMNSLFAVQTQNPLLWIINSAPFFLGLFARMAGIRQAYVQKLVSEQEQIIMEQTQELRIALAQAKEADKAKSVFLANMGNEVSAPMNMVVELTSTLRQTDLDEAQRQLVETIRMNGNSLLVSLENILDFARLEANLLHLEAVPFSLTECAHAAFELMGAKAAEKGVIMHFSRDNSVDDQVVGDKNRLRQIIVNLLTRGLKFTKKDGTISLSVSSQASPSNPEIQELTFTLVDTGLATPPAQLKRLFNTSSQQAGSSIRRYGETGLGLAISQNLCELMGGRIWAENTGEKFGNRYLFSIQVPCQHIPSNGTL